jgi:hypothetical protein
VAGLVTFHDSKGPEAYGREVYPEATAPLPAHTGSGGVYCAGAWGLAWEWIDGGVMSWATCDGLRVVQWAYTPLPPPAPAERAPVAAEPAPWEATWPAAQWANVRAVDACESSAGEHPDTYRLDAVHGGRMQIAKAVWAEFFAREYGWSWERVVLDDATNFAAAYVIWERSGSWAPWPFCGRGLE